MASYSKEIDVDMMEPTLSPLSAVKDNDNFSSQGEKASWSSSEMLGTHLGGLDFNE